MASNILCKTTIPHWETRQWPAPCCETILPAYHLHQVVETLSKWWFSLKMVESLEIGRWRWMRLFDSLRTRNFVETSQGKPASAQELTRFWDSCSFACRRTDALLTQPMASNHAAWRQGTVRHGSRAWNALLQLSSQVQPQQSKVKQAWLTAASCLTSPSYCWVNIPAPHLVQVTHNLLAWWSASWLCTLYKVNCH